MNRTVADFLAADISVTEIVDIWRGHSVEWERSPKAPRDVEGLLFFLSGGNCYEFGDSTFEARAGQVVRLPAGIPYGGIRLSDEKLRFICVDFKTAAPGEFMHFPLPLAYTPADGDVTRRAFETMHSLWHAHAVCGRLNCKTALMTLLSKLAAEYASAELHCDNRSRILQITDYIRQMAHRSSLRITDIAAHFHLSEAHLRRVFTAEIGISPSAYLAEVRIELARELLLDPRELSIREIAESCGYTSVYYFSSAFHERAGCSPSDFRRNGRLLL